MHYFSLDHWIVYAFLLITLGVGLWAGRGTKDLQEYACLLYTSDAADD